MKSLGFALLHATLLLSKVHRIKSNGEHEISNSGYKDYYKGTLNVILSAPHGGSMKPSFIPDTGCRDSGTEECLWSHNCTEKDSSKCRARTFRDMNTKDLALRIRDELYSETGEYPYIIINNLHRSKLDANRDRPEATFGEEVPEVAWNEYHNFIDRAKAEISGPGLFIDVHGHGHANNWAELGYLIKKDKLNSGDFQPEDTSIRSLASRVVISFDELLVGEQSFGKFIQGNNFSAVPSSHFRNPGQNKYYSGGYNTRRHGSIDSGEIDAIQIESSRNQRSDEIRPQYAKALAKSIKSFMEMHYVENQRHNQANKTWFSIGYWIISFGIMLALNLKMNTLIIFCL